MTRFVVSKMYHTGKFYYVDADNKNNAVEKTIGKNPDRIFENYISDNPIAVITVEEFWKMYDINKDTRPYADDDDDKINLAGV